MACFKKWESALLIDKKISFISINVLLRNVENEILKIIRKRS